MKLFSFRVYNYKSIIDSKDCHLSPYDGITVLAGQNESGKSSLLQALRDYEEGIFSEESKREDDEFFEPVVECVFENNNFIEVKARASTLWDKNFQNDLIFLFLENLKKIHVRLIEKDGKMRREVYGETLEHLKKWFEDAKSIDINDSKQIYGKFKGVKLKDDNKEAIINFFDSYISIEDISNDLAINMHLITPAIIMFDDMCDLLPDTILVSDLIDKNKKALGYQAVKNIEKILDDNFVEFDKLTDGQRMKKQNGFKKNITAKFNERWRQRVGNENGATIHVSHFQGGATAGSYYKFFIETKDGELLAPGKRSQGFKWLLSFYLHLTAENKTRTWPLVILFDEPGLYLHSKAQSDMLAIFEELSERNQIIYSTHSPYLIDSNKLHRARLIINTAEGTKVEKLTTNVNGTAHDALKPIIDAIGLDMRNSFTPSNGGKNVIVEGISDYYYFKSFMHMLNIQDSIYFLPAMGASNAHLLMELCMGWGLDWLIIFDEKGTKREVANIKKKFFPIESELGKRIHILKEMDGIEDMFDVSDLRLAVDIIQHNDGDNLGKTVNRYGGKELVSRLFSDKVFGGEIKIEDIDASTVENFRKVFEFIKG